MGRKCHIEWDILVRNGDRYGERKLIVIPGQELTGELMPLRGMAGRRGGMSRLMSRG